MAQEPQPNRHVLVVEDEYVIARDMTEALERSGVHVLGPVGTLEAAMTMLNRNDDIAGAVLDIRVRGNDVYPVAEALRKRKVPFVFVTGFKRDAIAPGFRDAACCEKPVPAMTVVDLLQTEMIRTHLRETGNA